MAKALPGLRVDARRMQHNIDSVRATLAPQAGRAWFEPALAETAALLTRERIAALRAQHAAG
jgi:hypothetical protein